MDGDVPRPRNWPARQASSLEGDSIVMIQFDFITVLSG